MINVFFHGYGCWRTQGYYYEAGGEEPGRILTGDYCARGVFRLSTEDEMVYKYTKSLEGINRLLPSLTHYDCEFSRYDFTPIYGDVSQSAFFDLKDHIDQKSTMVIVEPESEVLANDSKAYTDLDRNEIDHQLESQTCLVDDTAQLKDGATYITAEAIPGISLDSPSVITEGIAKIRLDNLKDFFCLVEEAAKAKGIHFDRLDVPFTKEQLLVELKMRYPKNFKIGEERFNAVWREAKAAGICASTRATKKKGETFFKKTLS